MNLILLARANWREAIDFVEENNTRLTTLGFFEQQAQLPFSFTDPFRQAICSFPHEKVDALVTCRTRGSESTRYKRLSCPGRPMK